MLVDAYKLDAAPAHPAHYAQMDAAIRSAQFVRNTSLRRWMDTPGTTANALQVPCSQLAHDFPCAAHRNSQARQASADRAWEAISRVSARCNAQVPGKKGSPRFQHDNRSVEDKGTGGKREPDGRPLTCTDGCGSGRVRLVGTRAIDPHPLEQITRVRLVRRADGSYAQFCVEAARPLPQQPPGQPPGHHVGIDLGLKGFYADAAGRTVENPRFLRPAARKSKRLHRQVSRTYDPKRQKAKQPQSQNYQKARQQLAKAHLQVQRQRQREDFARKPASALVRSCDLLAYEHLQIRNLVRNHHLAKSLHDAAWGRFLLWVAYDAKLHGIPVIAVPPQYTTQACSGCGFLVRKSLSTRTHVCPRCGLVLDRDENAARNILELALVLWENLRGLSSGQSTSAIHRTAGQAGTGSG